MANIIVKDASGNNVELKATGAGTAGDPFIIQHAFSGLVAHDSPQIAANNPIVQGAVARSTNLASVQDNDVTNLCATLGGALIVQPGAAPELEDVNGGGFTTSSETVLIPAVANVRHVLQTIILGTNHGYSAEVEFRDSTAGTVRFFLKVPANQFMAFNMPDGWAARNLNSNWTAKVIGTANATYPTYVYCKSYRRSH